MLRTFASVCFWIFVISLSARAAERPNVLFIAIDDLNDWVGVFGGHPKAQTPNLDQFAKSGCVVFQNAHCAGPVCGPSRSAILSGFMPHRSGVYGNANNMLDSKLVQTHFTMPEYFSRNGYVTISRGKIAHKHSTKSGFDSGHWMYDHWERAQGGGGVDPNTVTSRDKNLIEGKLGSPSKHTRSGGSEFSWGVSNSPTNKTKDYLTARWAAEQLTAQHDKPFFLAVGFSKPHLPFYSPQEFWDRFPKAENYLPKIREDDFDDVRRPDGSPLQGKSADYLWLEQNNLLNEAARAYLVCCTYADHCVGVVLDALASSQQANNTIVVIWGDHGWHLGEKLRYRKASLWSESTRCPLMIRTPDMSEKKNCNRAVNLVDFFPTLIDLCGLPQRPMLDGRSIASLLKDPTKAWFPTLTIRGKGDASVHNEYWNLIRRESSRTYELYDLKHDPMEWKNLWGNPNIADVQRQLELHLPKSFADPISKFTGKKKRGQQLDQSIRPRRLAADLK